MNSSQTILIFFRLANFGVLIGIFWYLWKRFGRQIVQSAYNAQIDYLDTLSRTHTVLRKEHNNIKKTIRFEDEDRAMLKERLFTWRQAVDKEHYAMATALDDRKKKLDIRLKEQIARVSEYRLYQSVKGDALAEIKENLSSKFAAEKSQELFISKAMKRMESA